ncbi:unnamed protein product [Blepharisma stoltei]|uniref:Uncharacterized protein n=1 Tax=Blepharisma stoltei TaxID=1481888 RepID=A0AAU9IW41_9CILI|nr:unnamed protein product [Blepharisma stoltei]
MKKIELNHPLNSKDKKNLKLFVDFSEDRLRRVKSGKTLSQTLSNQKTTYGNFRKLAIRATEKPALPRIFKEENQRKAELKKLELPEGICYETTERLIAQSTERHILSSYPSSTVNKKHFRVLTPAMEEYLNSRGFSPQLEDKKLINLDSHFLEKFQLISDYLKESQVRHTIDSSVIKLQSNINLEKTNSMVYDKSAKEKIDPIEKKLLLVDTKINAMIDESMEKEKQRIEENEKKTIKIDFEKNRKVHTPAYMKFTRLNKKGKYLLWRQDELKKIEADDYAKEKKTKMMDILKKNKRLHSESTPSLYKAPKDGNIFIPPLQLSESNENLQSFDLHSNTSRSKQFGSLTYREYLKRMS